MVPDPNLWLRPSLKSDGEQYYEYVLIYVDNVLAISNDTDIVMKQMKEKFKFKGDNSKDLEIYLGSNINSEIHNGTKLWTMSSSKYLKAAIVKVE